MADQTDWNLASPTAPSPIRRSCYFCRSRKIRCSGGQVCTACRTRNMDCVYSKEASKGRPKASKPVSTSLKGVLAKGFDAAMLPDPPPNEANDDEATLSNPIRSPLHLPSVKRWPPSVATDFTNPTQKPSIATDCLFGTALEDAFRRKWQEDLRSLKSAGPADWCLMSEVSLQCPAGQHKVSDTINVSHTNDWFKSCSQTSPLLRLSQDLTELVSKRFGSLGSFQREGAPTEFKPSLLTQDKRPTMFESDREPESLPKYSDHQLCQLIELWVFHHPLSFLVSKTLLLHSYRNETHDQSLIAVILGGACQALEDAESVQGQKFFEWANIHLRRRNAESPSISTVQVLILLGWHELYGSNVRRAFCYIEIARMALKDIQHRCEDTPLTNVDRINGVQVGKVELELCQRMYWVTFALDLWAAMQMNVPFDTQTALNTDVKFPPMEKNSSAAYTLDERSGNSAALKEQENAMKELWPLCHIASTIGHIYALYPHQTAAVPTSPVDGWESQIIPGLRRLVNGPTNLSIVCQSIRHVLSDGINAIVTRMASRSSDFFVLSAYRILIVQLMFPKSEPSIPNELVTDAIHNDIIYNVGAFKYHAEILCRSSSDSELKELGSVESSLLVLGIDTCSRALYRLHVSLAFQTTVTEGWLTSLRGELTELARGLHCICKFPRLRTAPTLPPVKKQLKGLLQDFETFGHSAFGQGCLSRPADPFPEWFESASDPEGTPVSGITNFGTSGGFEFASSSSGLE